MNQKESVEINTLKHLAIQNNRNLATDEELEKIDITPMLWKELQDTLKAKELINIQIIGEVISGKSTIMAKIIWKINQWVGHKMSLKMICADQLEFSRKILNPNLKNCATGVDEWNELSTTGLSSSTEQAFLKYASDVMAQRYLHRVSCSPTTLIDPNATIILQCLGKNTQTKTTRVIARYRLTTAEAEQIQTLGHADIYVGDVMQQTWYKQYRTRKFKKMNLVIREGVKDIRELEYSEMILKVYKKLKGLAEMGLIDRDLINNQLENQRRKDKRFLSILASDDLTSKIKGLLRLVKVQKGILQQIEKRRKLMPIARNINIKKTLKKEIGQLNQALTDARQNETELIQNYENLIQLNKQYQAI